MLTERKAKRMYKEMVEICISDKRLSGSKESIERLKKGVYIEAVEQLAKKNISVHEEETNACIKVEEFLSQRDGIRYRFDDTPHTFYDLADGCIEISPRSMKFKQIMPNTSLESIIMLSYMRACGYREAYQEKWINGNKYSYEEYYNFLAKGNNTKIKVNDGIVNTETILDKDRFKKLLRNEYLKEIIAWRYVIKVLEANNYEVMDTDEYGNLVCMFKFVKEEVLAMGEYYLQKKIAELSRKLKDKEMKVCGTHSFKTK